MKGVIAKCLEEMMITKFGAPTWKEVLDQARLPRQTIFFNVQDIDDDVVKKTLQAAVAVTRVSPAQLYDMFGEYWVNTFAPKIYAPHYQGITTARDFMLKMDKVHLITTQTMTNAFPPRFEYRWEDAHTLVMRYKSSRGMMDLMVGLIRGVGIYYKEDLAVTKLSEEEVRVGFPLREERHE